MIMPLSPERCRYDRAARGTVHRASIIKRSGIAGKAR